MKNQVILASILASVAVLLGLAGDLMATPISPNYCSAYTAVGCNTFACTSLGGVQTCSDGVTTYVNAFQQGYTYTPCGGSTQTKCPGTIYYVCFSGGYNPTATNPCGTLACGQWYTDSGC